MKIDVVIPSYKRSEIVTKYTLRFFPRAQVCMPEDQYDEYAKLIPKAQLLPHPVSVKGIPAARHWIAQQSNADCVLEIDDDLQSIHSYCWSRPRKITDHQDVAQIVRNACQIMLDLELPIAGWATAGSPLHHSNCAPFTLNKICSDVTAINRSLYGVPHGVEYAYDWVENEDGDLSMKALLKGRVIPKDVRFHWTFDNESFRGGLQGRRLKEDREGIFQVAKERWKKYYVMPRLPSGELDMWNCHYEVARKQSTAIAK